MIQKISSLFSSNEILKKSSISLLLKIIGSLLGYVFLLLVTRNSGASSWGIYILFLSVLNISSIFARLGLDTLTLKLVSASNFIVHQIKAIYFSSFRLVLLFSIIVSSLLFFVSQSVSSLIFHTSSLTFIIKWIALILPLFALICVNENIFRGLKMIKEFAFFQRTAKMLCSVIFFTVFYFGFGMTDPQTVVLSYISALIVIFLVSTLLVSRIILAGNFSTFLKSNKMLKQSIPMMMSSSVLLIMSWADSLMIGSFIGEYEVGIYNVAVKVALLISFTLGAVNSISAPKISQAYNNNQILKFKNIVIQATKTIFYSSLPAISMIFIFPEFLLSFFGKEFLLAKSALLILAFSQVINAMSGSVGIILNMTGKEKIFRNILVVALLINISFNLVLIPRYGIEGAAIASASSLVFWNLYSVFYVYRKYDLLTLISFRNE